MVMSLLESSKPINIDFSKGFTFFTSVKIRPQRHSGRKVIFQLAPIEPLFKLTLGLDRKDDLALWLEDEKGDYLHSISIKKEKFFLKSVSIYFSTIPGNNTGELPKLKLGVDKHYKQEDIDTNILVSEENVRYSIGGNLDGKELAAFDMAALSIYNISLSQNQIQQISNSLAKKIGGKK
jgi:hypothetical protein